MVGAGASGLAVFTVGSPGASATTEARFSGSTRCSSSSAVPAPATRRSSTTSHTAPSPLPARSRSWARRYRSAAVVADAHFAHHAGLGRRPHSSPWRLRALRRGFHFGPRFDHRRGGTGRAVDRSVTNSRHWASASPCNSARPTCPRRGATPIDQPCQRLSNTARSAPSTMPLPSKSAAPLSYHSPSSIPRSDPATIPSPSRSATGPGTTT